MTKEFIKILKSCDIGLNSFAMFRQLLTEGSTLKVKEYLARGLSIYSGCRDTAIPVDFQYYKVDEANIQKIVDFAKKMKIIPRYEIRNASEEFISKEILLKKLYDELKQYV